MMKPFLSCVLLAAAGLVRAEPTATVVSFGQAEDRTVTVGYALSGGPAVVTVDFQTNGVSVGGANLRDLSGDVNRLVTGESGTIVWRPSLDALADPSATVTAKVSAWPTSEPPPYMTVSLVADPIERVRYYPSAESLPGGLLENADYRTMTLVLRKIPAKGVSWKMGKDAQTQSAWGANYYMGVFETTQAQWAMVMGDGATNATFKVGGGMRPMENMFYSEWAVGDDSFLSRLNALTGQSFRLPTEAEWEYACRAGYANGYFNEGSVKNADNALKVARHSANSGGHVTDTSARPDKATAIVGSYAPSAWGLYDMIGNVWEYTSTIYSGSTHVRKGGSHDQKASTLDLYDRYDDTVSRSAFTGARVLLPL